MATDIKRPRSESRSDCRGDIERHSLLHFVSILGALLLSCSGSRVCASELQFYLAVVDDQSSVWDVFEAKEGWVVDDQQSDWVSDVYVTPSGRSIPIQRQVTPLVSVPFEEIRGVKLWRSPFSEVLNPGSTTVDSRLAVADALEAEFDAISDRYHGHDLLVVIGDRKLALNAIGARRLWGSVPGGAFGSVEDALEFYEKVDGPVTVIETSDEEVARLRDFYNQAARRNCGRRCASRRTYPRCRELMKPS